MPSYPQKSFCRKVKTKSRIRSGQEIILIWDFNHVPIIISLEFVASFLFSATVFSQHVQASALLKCFPLKYRNQTWMGGLYMQHGILSIRISGVTLIFSCAVGQMGLDKPSLRHKVKPTELIFSPPKNKITC